MPRAARAGSARIDRALDSIDAAAQSGSVTRGKVVSALFAVQNRDGALGSYSIDANGDTTLRDYGLYGISSKRLRFHHVVKSRGLGPQSNRHSP